MLYYTTVYYNIHSAHLTCPVGSLFRPGRGVFFLQTPTNWNPPLKLCPNTISSKEVGTQKFKTKFICLSPDI